MTGLLAFLTLAAFPPIAQDVPAFARLAEPIRSGEPIFQFNGKDLTGFYTYLKDNKYNDPKGVFQVKDGVIRVSGEEFGGFTTGGNFRDYHLVAEWKWGDKTWGSRAQNARDSGVLVHCVGPDGAYGGQWLASIECQVIEGGTGDFIMVGAGDHHPELSCQVQYGDDKQPYYHKGGETIRKNSGRYNWWGRDPAWKDQVGFRGARDVEKPHGEWNRMEVVCDGGTVTIILNGYVVNVGTDSTYTEGKIQFQSEGAELFFRKIEVRPLLKAK